MRLLVTTTTGGCSARIVPISGIEMVKSLSTSSRNASNSSSARSTSSTSSTLGVASSGLQQWPGHQEPAVVELGLEPVGVVDAHRLGGAQVQQLSREVPVVERLAASRPS